MKRAITLAMTTLASGVLFAATAVPAGAVWLGSHGAPPTPYLSTDQPGIQHQHRGGPTRRRQPSEPVGSGLQPHLSVVGLRQQQRGGHALQHPAGGHQRHQGGPHRKRSRGAGLHQRRVEPDRAGVQPDQGFVVTTPVGQRARARSSSTRSRARSRPGTRRPIPSPPASSTGTLEYSSPTAVYKGLDAGHRATMVRSCMPPISTTAPWTYSTVQFQPVPMPGGFTDPSLPAGYAPFGIQDLHNLIYVTYAKQDAQKHDDVAGPGHGFIDIYTPDGFLVERLASRGTLNAPWGMAIAPSSFGPLRGHAAGRQLRGRSHQRLQSLHAQSVPGPAREPPGPGDHHPGPVGPEGRAQRRRAAPGPCSSAPASTTRTTACLVPSTRPARRACQVRLRCCLVFMDSNAAACRRRRRRSLALVPANGLSNRSTSPSVTPTRRSAPKASSAG